MRNKTISEVMRHLNKRRNKILTKKQRIEIARKGGLAAAAKRKAKTLI